MIHLRVLACLLAVFVCCTADVTGQPNLMPENGGSLRDTAVILNRIEHARNIYLTYPDSAEVLLKVAVQESYRSGFHHGVILGLYNLSRSYIHFGRHKQGMAILQHLLQQCYTARSKLYIASALNNVGNIHNYTGQYEQALQSYLQAEKATDRYGTFESITGVIYNNIAGVLLKMRQPEKALPYLEKAEEISGWDKNYTLLIDAQANIGFAYLLLNDPIRSAAGLRKAQRTAMQYGAPSQRAEVLSALGVFYTEAGLPEKGLRFLKEAISLPLNANLKISAMGNMGNAWFQLGNYSKAIRCYEEVLKQAKPAGAVGLSMQAYERLARVYAAMGRYREAYDYSWLYFERNDSILGEKTEHNVVRFEVKYRTALKDREMAEKKLELTRQQRTIERKNMWIIIITVGAVLLFFLLLLLYRNYRNKRQISATEIKLLKQEQEITALNGMMKGEEQERIRIGRELHDGIGGMLAALKMGFSTLQEKHRLQEEKHFNDLMSLLDETGSEMRKTVHNLVPEMLTRLGLSQALQQYLIWKKKIWSPLHIELQIFGKIDDFPSSFQLTLYRLVQELIKNIVQHAEAREVLVQLNRDEEDGVFSLMVEDDGKGFDTSVVSGGIGLHNIKYRVNTLRGKLSVQSEKHKGSIVYIEFALEEINTILS